MKTLFLCIFFASLARADFFPELYSAQIKPTLLRAGDQTSLALWLSGTASVLVTRNSDNDIRDNWVNHQKMSADDARVGERYISYGINIGIAGLQLAFDHDNGFAHTRALALTGITTVVMKQSFARERPNQANHQSFPSGHTSSAFATATSLSYAYGWKAGVPAFAMAAWTGLSRLADDDHWLSDVVGGAFVGIIWGRAGFFSVENERETAANFSFLPYISSRSSGFSLALTF